MYLFSVQMDLRQCHYVVDLDTEEETPLEPRYALNKEEWNIIAFKPFLQASRYFPKLVIHTEILLKKKLSSTLTTNNIYCSFKIFLRGKNMDKKKCKMEILYPDLLK